MPDQHGHNRNIARQRSFQLDAHEIIRILQSSLTRRIAASIHVDR